jgi:hypothetical protein
MLYRNIIDVCYQIHTKHINALCGQKVELLNVELVVHIVTTGTHSECFPPFSLKQQTCNNTPF